MPQRMYLVNDPAFSEYVYNVLIHVPLDKILDLDDAERAVFKSLNTIRTFADNQGWEKRMLMLTRVGMSHCMIVGPKGYDYDGFLARTNDAISNEERRPLIEEMARNNIFVMSSRDILMSSHMAAQNSHSQIYVLNYEYTEMQRRVSMMQTDVYNVQQKDTHKGFVDLAGFVQATMLAKDTISIGAKVTEREMLFLLILFRFKNSFLSTDRISEEAGETKRSEYVLKTARNLVKNGYISQLPGKKQVEGRSSKFTIMEKGIDAVMFYLKYIAKRANPQKIS